MLRVIWVVLMILWLFSGGYYAWDPVRPAIMLIGLIPWLCVLIIGLVQFGAINAPPPS